MLRHWRTEVMNKHVILSRSSQNTLAFLRMVQQYKPIFRVPEPLIENTPFLWHEKAQDWEFIIFAESLQATTLDLFNAISKMIFIIILAVMTNSMTYRSRRFNAAFTSFISTPTFFHSGYIACLSQSSSLNHSDYIKVNGTNYEVPHCGAFSTPYSHLSWAQIFASWIIIIIIIILL